MALLGRLNQVLHDQLMLYFSYPGFMFLGLFLVLTMRISDSLLHFFVDLKLSLGFELLLERTGDFTFVLLLRSTTLCGFSLLLVRKDVASDLVDAWSESILVVGLEHFVLVCCGDAGFAFSDQKFNYDFTSLNVQKLSFLTWRAFVTGDFVIGDFVMGDFVVDLE